MTMIARKAEAFPSPFDWLGPNVDQLRLMILERSRMDVGILETAPNRGDRIDRYLRRAFVPEEIIAAGKGYWCAAWAGCMWIDAGAKVPKDFGACDAWLPYLIKCTRAELPSVAQPGDAVLYGVPGDAKHIGIVWRVSPEVLTIEGNRGLGGSSTNNGVAVDVDGVKRTDVLGIVRPLRAAP
jgi:hypothetical protein